jgi:hypothetical protein
VDLIFQLAVRAINGIYNRSTRPMNRRDADPEFYQLLDALQRMQRSEAIDFRLEKRGPEDVSLITFHGKAPRRSRQIPASSARCLASIRRHGNWN